MIGKENPQGDSVFEMFLPGSRREQPSAQQPLAYWKEQAPCLRHPDASHISHLFQSLLSVYDFVFSPFLKIYFIQSLNDPIILVFLFMYSFIQHTHRLSIFYVQDIVYDNCPCGPKKKF